jgi:xyloglucan 6-xylosyltransferase
MCQGEFGDNKLDECHEAFDRAYNFADNQVLREYGYQHTSLDSPKLQPL